MRFVFLVIGVSAYDVKRVTNERDACPNTQDALRAL
jgi:hypothetical protein